MGASAWYLFCIPHFHVTFCDIKHGNGIDMSSPCLLTHGVGGSRRQSGEACVANVLKVVR